MASLLFLFTCAAASPPCADEPVPCRSYLCRPAFCLDDARRGPAERYLPQPGDIFLASDPNRLSKVCHWLVGSGGVQHSGIMFARRDGGIGLLEAGPFSSLKIEVVDPVQHMSEHVEKGDRVWVRRRCVPLTPEQSARLTEIAECEEGKRFAVWRMLAQLTPLRSRGPLRTYCVGKVHGPDRTSYWCAELVVEACVYAALLDAADARPTATYPRDLFYGRSNNAFVDEHLRMGEWLPPARWTPDPAP
jgi:hypothetical protein